MFSTHTLSLPPSPFCRLVVAGDFRQGGAAREVAFGRPIAVDAKPIPVDAEVCDLTQD